MNVNFDVYKARGMQQIIAKIENKTIVNFFERQMKSEMQGIKMM